MLLKIKKKPFSLSPTQRTLLTLVTKTNKLKDNYNCDILKKTKNIVINTNSYSNFFESEERNKKKSIKYIFQNSYRNTSREKESSSDKSFLPTLSTEKIIKKNINSRNIDKLTTGNRKITIPLNQTFSNFNIKNKENSFRIKYLNKSNANTIENITKIIFSENEHYNYLNYDETQIFSKLNSSLKDKYMKYIFERINYLKNNENTNFTNLLTKKYESKENNFSLQLESIEIKFVNITKEEEEPIIFLLPFTYIPLFYYQNFYIFKYILLSLFVFKDNFNSIIINEKNLKKFLKISYLFKNNGITNTLNALFNNIKSIIHEEDLEIKEQKQLKSEIFIFLWNTPYNIYKVQILLPKINIIFNNLKKTLSHFIQKDLMIYLLDNNLLNWDFYIIKYLISFKKFRIIFEKNHTKLKYNKDEGNDMIYLISPKITNYIDKFNINKNFLFLNTNNQYKNKLYIIHPFELEINKYSKRFCFNFTFSQMKILSFISNHENLEEFLLKLLNENPISKKFSFNYNFFTMFNKIDYLLSIKANNLNITNSSKPKLIHKHSVKNKNVLKDFNSERKNIDYNCLNIVQKKKNIFNLHHPICEIIEINKNEIQSNISNDEIYQIKLENFNQLFDCGKEYLPKFLLENKNIIEKKIINNNMEISINQTTKNKKIMRKNTINSSISTVKTPHVKYSIRFKDQFQIKQNKEFILPNE